MNGSAALLSVAEMAEVDRLAIAAGVPGLQLMEAAGAAVARMVRRHHPDGRVLVLCGPGNNGGDGFVAARHLAAAGRDVTVALLGSRDGLRGDAAAMAQQWRGDILAADPGQLAAAAVVVDALFGAGLRQPLAGTALALVDAVNAAGRPVVAVDLPSGVHGDDGQPRGGAVVATRTVTFFRTKPGHLLYPGRQLCGSLHVADIGIPGGILESIGCRQWQNDPVLWRRDWPRRAADTHKYRRGHVLVCGGRRSGAAVLAGHGALRIGAGLVTLALPSDTAMPARAPHALMLEACDGMAEWRHAIADPRRNVLLLGPGMGRGMATRGMVLAALSLRRPIVLDADALMEFAGDPTSLFAAINGAAVLTPHDGEFARLFPDLAARPKLERARMAAVRSKAVVVLKGPDTVIAAPNGRVAVNANAPADLATAGAGDVLAGFCAGLLAQGMPAFEASAAAVWLHGAAALAAGPGLIADDLPEAVRIPLAALTPPE